MALINAKNGLAAVGLALAGATAASQALNTYLGKRQGLALANGIKPGMDAHQVELKNLHDQLEVAHKGLADAQLEILKQQREIDSRNSQANLRMGVIWFVLGIATPLALKHFFGIG
jgi:hypothetical protein